jgi:hypothetical protein
MHCSNCDRLVPAERLDWNDQTEVRSWGGDDDLRMGPFEWKSQPTISYYRRVRKCPSCEELMHTAEVDEARVRELARLREEVASLRQQQEAARAQARELARILE